MELSKWITFSCMILSLYVTKSLDFVEAAPISVNFAQCSTSTFFEGPAAPLVETQCCPVKPTKPIVEGMPPLSTNILRVRKAAQCTDKAYAEKLSRAYELMRALPDDDPRSLTQQWKVHCSYCGGAFVVNNTHVDIHWGWLFFPWHRLFLYFHERILQSLLGDPTFSLSYWNWDNMFTVGDGESDDGRCLLAGGDFPSSYHNPASGAYDSLRSASAKGRRRFRYPDLNYLSFVPEAQQPDQNATEEDFIASNVNVMYQTMISGGTSRETFYGSPYRLGSPRGTGLPNGGGGTLERSPHPSVHSWTGRDSNPNLKDMGQDMGTLAFAARDPVFYAHHSNVDRLWEVWKTLSPLMGQTHEDYSDPDFLNANFVFYDENKDLRRVTVVDALNTTKLGYVYQGTNDASWIQFNATKCSTLNYTQLITEASCIPVHSKCLGEEYCLRGQKSFTIVIDRPANPHGEQEFLTIKRIKLNRMLNAGFDVFVNLLDPSSLSMPSKCAEYNGRFANMATSYSVSIKEEGFTWRESITKTFVDIKAENPPSKVVITLLPFGHSETITFESIYISN